MARIGTVEKSLSSKRLHEFCARLAKLPNLTLERMRAEARTLGIELSHGAASRFKNGSFQKFLEKLNRVREFSQQVRAMREGGSELADAESDALMEDVFAFVARREDEEGRLDLKSVKELVGILSKMRSGDHRERELAAKLKEYERRAADWERKEAERKAALAALSKDSMGRKITPEFIDEVQRAMGLK